VRPRRRLKTAAFVVCSLSPRPRAQKAPVKVSSFPDAHRRPRRTMALMLVRFAFLLFSVLSLVACGPAAPRVAAPEMTTWERDMLGGPPDAHFIVRLDKARADPVYGGPPTPFDKPPSKPADPEMDVAMNAMLGAELWMIADSEASLSVLAVLRGPVPLSILRNEASGRKVLASPPERLPSGVLLYTFSEPKAEGIFLVLPSGTWVAATGRIVGRVRFHFFSHSADPPPALHEPDAIVAAWAGPGIGRLSPSTSEETSGLEGGGLVIRSSARGDLDTIFVFKDEKNAERAMNAVQALLALVPDFKKRLTDKCPLWESVTIELHRDGKAIAGRMSNLPPLIRAYRTGACRYE